MAVGQEGHVEPRRLPLQEVRQHQTVPRAKTARAQQLLWGRDRAE